MPTGEFAPATLDLLLRAGWTPHRQFENPEYSKRMSTAGYSISQAVATFLRSFGGLSIIRPTSLGDDCVSFDPVDAVSRIHRARVRAYEEILNTSLCVVGSYFTQTFTILMDPNGRVYGGADDTLRHLGDSGEEAIENLLTQHRSKLLRGG